MGADRSIGFLGEQFGAEKVRWAVVRLAVRRCPGCGERLCQGAGLAQAQRGAEGHALHVSSRAGVARMRVVACGWARNKRPEQRHAGGCQVTR